MDTEAMYQRGVADAELGEPDPFYYQHYDPYRRGYNQARRRLRRSMGFYGNIRPRSLLLLLALLIVGAGAAYLLLRPAPRQTVAISPTVAPTIRAATSLPERTPIFPTATPEPVPTPTPIELRVGGAAVVSNTAGQPLRGRRDPSVKAPVRVSFKEGERVTVVEGPVEADGYIWWRVESERGSGWSAARSKEGANWLQPAE